MLIQGFVQEKLERPSKYSWPNGKPKMMYAIKVDGTTYGTKNVEPACKQGDYVSFEASQNGQYWNADASTIRPAQPPVAQPQPVTETKAATTETKSDSKTGYVKKGGWDDPARQDAISYQAARKDAIETVRIMQAADLIDYGKARGAQKIEIVEILIDDYTVRYFNETKALAPKEHANPVDASYSEEVAAARKGRPKKITEAPQEREEAVAAATEDDLPW